MTEASPPILIAQRVEKTYQGGETPVRALRCIDLSLDEGDFVAIVGPSGCGKSTLLHVCGGMDRPTSGDVFLEGLSLGSLDDDRLTRVRRDRVGFVFQFFNLLPTLTVEENIALPLLLAGRHPATTTTEARALADRVGLGPRLRHYPAQLSGGELQRAAIARAVIHEPALIVADEPTGNLDSENGARVLELLVGLNRARRITLLLATHDLEVARLAHRVVEMRDGDIVRERPVLPLTDRAPV